MTVTSLLGDNPITAEADNRVRSGEGCWLRERNNVKLKLRRLLGRALHGESLTLRVYQRRG